MKVSLKQHMFVIFLACLLLSTYVGVSEELIIVYSLFFFLKRKKFSAALSKRNIIVCLFLVYYFLITLAGVIMGYTELMSLAKFIIEFCGILYCVSSALDLDNVDNYNRTLNDLRNFIIVSAIFGTYETIVRFNPLTNIVVAVDWLNAMNAYSIIRYQPSSFYLHYTYYAFFLLFGLIILLKYPYKNKIINLSAYCILIEQLFFSQSRMGWITFVILMLCYWVINTNLASKVKRKHIYCVCVLFLVTLVTIVIKPEVLEVVNNTIIKRFSSIKTYGMADGSLGQRLGTLLNYPDYVSKYPIRAFVGTGFQSIEKAFLHEYSYFKGYVTADNQYLELIVESGIVGFIIFVCSIMQFLKKGWDKKDDISVFCKIAFLLLFIQGITYSLTSYFQFVMVLLIFCLWNHINKSRFNNKKEIQK